MPLATQSDYNVIPENSCWREWNVDICVRTPVNWRTRALAAEGLIRARCCLDHDPGAAEAHRAASLRAALDAACDLGEPMRGPDDRRLHGPHRVDLVPMFTTGLTRDQLHERWAELRRMAGEPVRRST